MAIYAALMFNRHPGQVLTITVERGVGNVQLEIRRNGSLVIRQACAPEAIAEELARFTGWSDEARYYVQAAVAGACGAINL